MLNEIKEIIKEIKSISDYQDIQIKKLEDARDISDNKFTEMSLAMDAIRFDHENIKQRINKIMEFLK